MIDQYSGLVGYMVILGCTQYTEHQQIPSPTLILDHKTSSEDNRRFLDIMMFVTGVVSTARGTATGLSHLSVPTPPASRISAVSVNGFPTQRMAKARRIWPCATIRTSP